MTTKIEKMSRIPIPYFEGVNTLVGSNIAKKEEFEYVANARSKTIGTIEKREGTRRLGNIITATGNYGLFFFENNNGVNTGFFRISTVAAVTTIYYLKTDATWTPLTAEGTNLSAAQFSSTIAEGCCFLVNNTDANRYIESDGSTVVTSAVATGHLYGSPKANKINYYKDRLYLGDYTATTRYKNGIMMSSKPLGIVALVDGDHANIAADSEIKVTDLKYIHSTDTLDVYRGGTKIADITIDAKNADANTITINTVTMAFGTDFKSADEIWVDGTYTGAKKLRWADNPSSGIDVQVYDTLKLTGGQNDRITMMTNINDVMVIGNKSSLSVWNDYNLRNIDIGVGCVSDRGYDKAFGKLYFVDYTGLYSFSGEGLPKLESAKIQKYFDGATKAGLEASAVGKQGMSIFVAIGDVTLYKADGSIDRELDDVVLELNLRQNNWFVHTGLKVEQFATYNKSSIVDRLEFASSESNYPIFELFNGFVDDDVSNPREILMEVVTPPITLNKNFENFSYPTRIIVETERGSNLKCFIALDNGDPYEIKGDIKKGCTILKVTKRNDDTSEPPRCKQIKLFLKDYSTQLCKISRIAIEALITNEEELP